MIVEGLFGETVTVRAALYGPFATREAIRCAENPVWSGTVEATGDGEYTTAPVRLTVPGFYTYQEVIDAGDLVRRAVTPCADEAETTIVPGAPQVRTQVSDAETQPGSRLSDRVIVTGLGALTATVEVDLFGPFRTRGGITCDGSPLWTGNVTASGDGTYTTQPVTLERVGYYVYRESIAETPQYSAFAGKCGEAAETTITRAEPKVTTVVSNEVVAPGFRITDTVRVTQVSARRRRESGSSSSARSRPATGSAQHRRALLDGRDLRAGRRDAADAARRAEASGFYTYREHLVGSELVQDMRTACGEVAETALARPLILTGRNERVVQVRAAAVGLSPERVRMAARGIDAPVFAVGIDIRGGALAAPANVGRLGWWRDGSDLGSPTGSVLIAGHVDSRSAGPGRFFALRARRGRPGP